LTYVGTGTPIPDCTTCPTPCAATTVTSGSCQYDIPRLNIKNGFGGRTSTYTGATKTEGYSGNITVSCNNGTLTTTNVTCTPNNCTAQPYSPTNQACSYSIPAINSGQPPVFVDTNTAGYSGRISVTCNAGKITVTQSVGCSELPCAYAEFVSPAGCTFSAGPLISRQSGNAMLIKNTRVGYTGPPYSGSATVECLRGAINFTTAVCNSNCLGANTTSGACTFTTGEATTYVLQHNQSQSYNSTNPPGTVSGIATALCLNGTTQWQSKSCTGSPAAPVLSATKGDASANVTWVQGGNGGAEIASFDLRYSDNPTFAGGGATLLQFAADRSATINGLTNGTVYYLSIRANNVAGFTSPWSNTVTIIPCGIPTAVTLDYAFYNVPPEVTLTYTCPTDQFDTTPTLTAEKSTDNGVTWTTFATLLPYDAGQLKSVLRNLPGANSAIRTQIRLRTTVADCGEAFSNVKTVVLEPCAPGMPSFNGLDATPACSSLLKLKWGTAARTGCPPVTGYYLECKQTGVAYVRGPQTYTGLTGEFSRVYGGLTYNCVAIAYNEGGESLPSPASNGIRIINVQKPGYAPVTIGEVRGDRIAITWLAAFDGAAPYRSPVTSYTISRREVSNRAGTVTTVATVTAGVLSYLVTGLKPRTAYEFRVVAANACGAGPDDGWSAPGTTTDDATPSTPTLTATADTACNATQKPSISLSWTASTVGAGFNPIAEYRIDRSTDQLSWTRIAETDGTTTRYNDTEGTTTGITYYYRVFASNNSKLSAASNVASAVAPAAPPGAPQNLTATNGGGSGASATISWSPPTTGGSTVGIRYYLQYQDADTLSWFTAASNLAATTYTKTGLMHGKTYYFTVSAINTACGAGKYGPKAPSVAVTVYNPNCTCPAVSLTATQTGGCTFSFPSTGPTGNQTVNNTRSGYSGSASRMCTTLCEASAPFYTCTQNPPSTTTYNCVSGSCNAVSGSGGTYSTLTDCQNNCSGGTMYNCVNNVCTPVTVGAGQYTNQAACIAAGCGGGGGLRSCTLSPVTNVNGCTYPFSGTIPGNTYSGYVNTTTSNKAGSAQMYCNGTTGQASFDAGTATCNNSTPPSGCSGTCVLLNMFGSYWQTQVGTTCNCLCIGPNPELYAAGTSIVGASYCID
jgi:titin